MSRNDSHLRAALARIADIARDAADGPGHRRRRQSGGHAEQGDPCEAAVCVPKSLPSRMTVAAAQTARLVNPVNAPPPAFGQMAAGTLNDIVSDPLRIALLTSKYWGPAPRRLAVSFLEHPDAALRARILSHMNAWSRTGCVSFVETSGVGQVRISLLGSGYWSYLGTDILHIPSGRATMNLQGFSMNTPESEYRRVVRHETGHTLGFPHEHMRQALVARIDRQRAYDFFWRTQRWDPATVDAQVLTPLNEMSLMATPADQTSIMCYQLPGSITRDGRPILGGTDINPTDSTFAGRIYPRSGAAPAQPPRAEDDEGWEDEADADDAGDWDEEEDVADAHLAVA